MLGTLGKLFVWVLLLLNTSKVQAEIKCQDYKFYYTLYAKKIFETEYLCLDWKSGHLTNKKCKDKKCLNDLNVSKDLLRGKKQTIGTRGFYVCHNLGGSPQILKIEKPNKKYQTFDRCILPSGAQIDTGTLLKYYLDSDKMN